MKQKWLLVGIIVLAFLLRVLALDKFPVGFTPDEASFGYDAYSILKTGRDQWGHFLPLVLESFGDFKAPLYSYILIPFVGLLGLTKLAVRLPNALLGTSAVYVIYLLVGELGKYSRLGKDQIRKLQLISTLLLTVSSWHVMMSRGGFEANLTTLFLPLGIYLFLIGLRKCKYLSWSALVFGLNLFTYHSARVVTPFVVLMLLIFWRKELVKIWKQERQSLLKSVVVLGVFLLLGVYTFTRGAATRAVGVSVYGGALEAQAQERYEAIYQGMNPTLARILHNKHHVAWSRFLSNYRQYFSYHFLFSDGPGETTYGMLPGQGVLYLFELPLLIGFLLALYKQRNSKCLWLTVGWILVAPIPAALAMGVGYHANRAEAMLPALQIVLAVGAFELYCFFSKNISKRMLKMVIGIYISVSILMIGSFLGYYFINSPTISASGMLYGNIEVFEWLKENASDENIIVSRKLSEPQIYAAFVNKWNPQNYQLQSASWDYRKAGVNWVDQISSYRLGNYLFENIDWEKHGNLNLLLVGKPEEFPNEVSPVKTIFYPNGDRAIYIVDLRKDLYANATID